MLKVRADGPALWRDLLAELDLIAKNLPERLSGSTAKIPTPSRGEECYEVHIDMYGVAPRLGCVRLWHVPGTDIIRGQRLVSGADAASDCTLRLCSIGGKLQLLAERRCEPMTPEAAAEYLLRPLLDFAMGGALA